jgi:hypothetical protein
MKKTASASSIAGKRSQDLHADRRVRRHRALAEYLEELGALARLDLVDPHFHDVRHRFVSSHSGRAAGDIAPPSRQG